MIHIVRIAVPTFLPRDATILHKPWSSLSEHEQQAYNLAHERDDRVRQAFHTVVWYALRRYFGDAALPDQDVIEAAKNGDLNLLGKWDRSVSEEIDPDPQTFFYSTYLQGKLQDMDLLLEVGHGDHWDLLLLGSALELILRHPAIRDDSDLLAGFFRPLLAACTSGGLSPANHTMEVAFIDERGGFHTSALAAFLELRGLS